MKKEEKGYQKYISKELPVPDLNKQISSQIEFSKKKGLFMNKKILFASVGGVSLVAASAIALCVLGINKPVNTTRALVTMDVNPSVEFVIDEENKVISVNGKNDEGKMIVYGEAIVGKTLQEAIDIVIKVENETGYLIDGNISVDTNKITVSVNADSGAYETLINQVNSYVEQTCEKYNIESVIEKGVQYTKDQLAAYVLTLDSSLTEEDVKNRTYEQLIDIVAVYHLERSSICSEKLEYYYNEAKESKIEFAENEATKEAINNANELYQIMLTGFNQAFDSLQNLYTSLNNTIYESFVSENSIFQKSLASMNDYKNEVIKLRNQVAKYEEDNEVSLDTLKTMLEQAETSLDNSMNSLKQTEQSVISQIEKSQKSIQSAMDSLNEIKNSFPQEIKTLLQDVTKETEDKINEIKDNFFETFEKENKEDIERFQQEVADRKQALIDSIKNK